MYGNSALAASPAVEGAFVFGYDNPAATLVSPVPAGLRAGSGGVAIGRFGWYDVNGVVRNERLAATDVLGLVVADVPLNSDWRNVFFDDTTCTYRIREGLPVTMAGTGKLWARFRDGAQPGLQVYADVLDGRAIAGYSLGAEPTPWSVATFAEAKGVAIITPWSKYQ
jgi:hypothetical protein